MLRQALTWLGIVALSGSTAVWCYRASCPPCAAAPGCCAADGDLDRDQSPEDRLRSAVINGDAERVRQLLALPRLDLHRTWGPKRLGIVHYAAAGHGTAVGPLCAAGADANARTAAGETPLMYVLGSPAEQACAVRSLLQAGATLEAADTAGQTPLIRAACKGDAELIRLLLEVGADPAARDRAGHSAASITAEDPHLRKALLPD